MNDALNNPIAIGNDVWYSFQIKNGTTITGVGRVLAITAVSEERQVTNLSKTSISLDDDDAWITETQTINLVEIQPYFSSKKLYVHPHDLIVLGEWFPNYAIYQRGEKTRVSSGRGMRAAS